MSTAAHKPQSCTDLFMAFLWMAMQGFGGVFAVVQRELVEKKQWMTREQFVEDWAVAQILPGPNVVNLSLMLGGRHFGLAGALSALAGLLLAPLALVLLLISSPAFADRKAADACAAGLPENSAAIYNAAIGQIGPQERGDQDRHEHERTTHGRRPRLHGVRGGGILGDQLADLLAPQPRHRRSAQ